MKWLTATVLSLGLGACASSGVETYRAETPVLDLQQYFSGTLDGWGIFQGRSGHVERRFHVVIEARWTGDTGILDEYFTWSDASTSRRVWTLTRQADGTWRGQADDVVGEAVGEIAGNALHWRYVMALPVGGKVYHVDFDDWMFLMDDTVMLNRSYLSKWSVSLGEVSLTFVKR